MNSFVQNEKYPGAALPDDRPPLTIADDCRISNSRLGEGVSVYHRARVEDSVLRSGSSVGDDSILVRCSLEEKVILKRRGTYSNMTIGRGSSVSNQSVINCAVIGRYCPISWNVTIGGGDHPMDSLMMMDPCQLFSEESSLNGLVPGLNDAVTIGNDVWIGSGANIQTGVTIGDGAVIGANAVVTKDIPPYAVVVGVPTKIIRFRFPEHMIRELLDLQWWNYTEEQLLPFRACFDGRLTEEKLERLKEIKRR